MYQSSSESSIEHGHFPSVINLYAVGEGFAKQNELMTQNKPHSAVIHSTANKNVEKIDPFLALVHQTKSTYPQNSLNDDEVSYASSSTYSQSPNSPSPPVSIPSMQPIGYNQQRNVQTHTHTQPFVLPYKHKQTKKQPPDRQGSCGSPPSSDSDSDDCRTPRPSRRRTSTTSTSDSSGDDMRTPYSSRSNRSTLNTSRIRKSLLPHNSLVHRPILNIVGSPSPSSNTVSSGGSGPVRHSLVSQFSSITGRLETTLAESIALQVADSGISNTSPETQSSTEFHTNRQRSIDTLSSPTMLPHPQQAVSPPSLSPSGILKAPKDLATQHNLMQAAFKSSLFSLLSGIYGLLLCCWGFLMPVAELVSNRVPLHLFEGFYIYLYIISIAFLIYVYLYLVREGSNRIPGSAEAGYSNPRPQKRRFLLSAFGLQAGSLYLRLGAVGFGIVSMIRDGIIFASIVQHGSFLTECSSIILAVRPLLAIVFTFIQLNFIFLNSKMCIHKYKALARFGLAHMIATNICIWMKTVISDSVADFQSYQRNASNISVTINAINISRRCSSEADELLQGIRDRTSPYLYPTTIQYSVLAAAIIWVTWKNVGSLKINQTYSSEDSPDSTLAERGHVPSSGRRWKSLDCAGSHRGLFLGLATLVGATVCLLTSSVLMQKQQYNRAGMLVSYCGEAALLIASIICILVAFPKMADMLYVVERDCLLENVVHFVSLTGVLFYWATFMFATHSLPADILICSIMHLIQGCLQAVFISTALKRMSYKAIHEREKPGRELVTFLLICNLALFVFATTEPLRMQYGGSANFTLTINALALSDHISRPLYGLYRFHSVVALAAVWKDAYKFKSH